MMNFKNSKAKRIIAGIIILIIIATMVLTMVLAAFV